MNIIDKLICYLEEERILPISKETWESFIIDHCCPDNEQSRKLQCDFIKEQVKQKSGIYIYMKDDKCLYVGKAKFLFSRIKSHYIESFSPVSGDTPDMRWHRFFLKHQGEVEIYWKEFQSEDERVIIERILTKLLRPVFLTFK